MSAQWQSLVSQKLYLATQLAKASEAQASPTEREACLQGAIELALRARDLMLTLIARYHQEKQAMPRSLEALADMIGTTPDIEMLQVVALTTGSWWQHLEQLELSQSQPPRPQKSVSDENIIAVSVAQGPDRSVEGLLETLAAMKTVVTDLGERHAEW